ncbi:MAG: HAD hydrolase-like protein [Candidatus Eisenbacteria bacterium]|nr:HAD hydrolase-like protein [Candidatus Eisenbacteria bacterium]
MRRFDLVILDLDGTLYSSTRTTLGAVERAVNELNERHGLDLSVPDEATVLGGVGRTRDEFARVVLPDLDESLYDELDELIWKWENALISRGLGSLYDGARDALEGLEKKGYELAVATNAGADYMDHILDIFDLRRYFSAIRCAGCENTTDKAHLIRRILEELDTDPERSVMVGDRASDVDAAQRCGTASVGCTWGFGSRAELEAADRVADCLGELVTIIETWDGERPTVRISDIASKLPVSREPERRDPEGIDTVVLHCTAMPGWDVRDTATYHTQPNHISDEGCPTIAYAYFIEADGRAYRCLPDDVRAWHVGPWNDRSIGVCLAYEGADEAPPARQLEVAAAVCAHLVSRFGLSPDRVLAHRELEGTGFVVEDGRSVQRKECPGMRIDMDAFRDRVREHLEGSGDVEVCET